MKRGIAIILACLLVLVSADALADYGAILKEDAGVYADPDLREGEVTLPRYAAVVVKSVEQGRAEIVFGGNTGFVSSDSLSRPWEDFKEARLAQGIEHTEDCLRYVKESCDVYDYPDTKAHKLKRVEAGTVLTGFREHDGWSIVMDETETYYGYIQTSFLEGVSGGDGSHYALD